MLRTGLAQMSMTRDPEENLSRGIGYLQNAAGKGVQLICFPELQFSPFFPQHPGQDATAYLMDLDHPVLIRFREAVAASKMVTVANFYMQTNEGSYDASPLFGSDGTILGISKMVHIVQIPRFYEQDYYTPSDEGFKVYNTPVGKIGIVICFDRHFPESIRSCALQGAELILIPTAVLDDEPLEKFIWEMRIAAMHNRVFIAMCNRTGQEGRVAFCGHSFLVSPEGDCIAEAGKNEELLITDIDTSLAKTGKDHPYISLRRPEKYIR